MAGSYVEIGPMAYIKDTTKVPVKYATGAQRLMKEAATAAVRATTGFTPDKIGTREPADLTVMRDIGKSPLGMKSSATEA